MARKVRIFIKDASQHILLKSLDAITLFQDANDYETFLQMIATLSEKHSVAIHAYVVMPHYFEFLATPADADALPKFMQSLGRGYVAYFNKKYKRKGTLWEGRYKASLLQDSVYLFDVMRYIEKQSSMDYSYTSLHRNLFKKVDAIVSPHRLYRELGFTDEQRAKVYAKIFHQELDKERVRFIKHCLTKQLVTADADFLQAIEQKLGLSLRAKERGRPKKEIQQQRKKMYKNLVVLDKVQHKALKLNPLKELSFAKDLKFLPVTASEVALVGATFPVVFTADAEPKLIALISLGGDNLAINHEGKWIAPYLPSFIRKYPFSLAGTKENPSQKVILIDEDSGLFSKTKGKQLFTKDGTQSETLENAIKFLTAQEKEMTITANVAKLIAKSGILEEREISVGEGEEKKVLVNGFQVVNREKLHALSDDILADWVRKGIITLIDAHIKSLENIQTLFNIAHQRQN